MALSNMALHLQRQIKPLITKLLPRDGPAFNSSPPVEGEAWRFGGGLRRLCRVPDRPGGRRSAAKTERRSRRLFPSQYHRDNNLLDRNAHIRGVRCAPSRERPRDHDLSPPRYITSTLLTLCLSHVIYNQVCSTAELRYAYTTQCQHHVRGCTRLFDSRAHVIIKIDVHAAV